MKFIRNGEVVEELDAVAYEGKCAHCGVMIPISQFTADLLANEITAICKTKGWPVPTRDEVALCKGCYRNHRVELSRQIEQENADAERWWSAFVEAWPKKRPNERSRMEQQFRERWPWLGARMSEWVAKQHTAQTTSRDSAAGFE